MTPDTRLILETIAAGCATALVATPLVRRIALRVGYVATPNERSVHRIPVPYMGGVAIFAAFLAAVLVAGLLPADEMRTLLLGGLAIVVLGAIDDYRPLPAWLKALGQLAVALGVSLGGVVIDHVTDPFGGILVLGSWGIPVTVIWIWVVVNIINLADGLDGLAAGITAIAAVTMLISALLTGQPALAALLCAALIGASLGFLPYNFNPAKIFMGDAGAMFLGYVLATIAIQGSLKAPAAITLAVPVLALGVPLFDFLFAVVRRWQAGQPIMNADRGHLHHRLLNLGLSQRETVLLLYCVSGWLAIGSLAIVQLPVLISTLVLAFVGFTVYVAVTVLRLRQGGLSAAATREPGRGGKDPAA